MASTPIAGPPTTRPSPWWQGQAATAPGQIVVTHETREDGEYTVISGNTGDDNAPEFRISLSGNHNLTVNDFNL